MEKCPLLIQTQTPQHNTSKLINNIYNDYIDYPSYEPLVEDYILSNVMHHTNINRRRDTNDMVISLETGQVLQNEY